MQLQSLPCGRPRVEEVGTARALAEAISKSQKTRLWGKAGLPNRDGKAGIKRRDEQMNPVCWTSLWWDFSGTRATSPVLRLRRSILRRLPRLTCSPCYFTQSTGHSSTCQSSPRPDNIGRIAFEAWTAAETGSRLWARTLDDCEPACSAIVHPSYQIPADCSPMSPRKLMNWDPLV